MLVAVDNNWIALALGHVDRGDLILEASGFHGRDRFTLGFHRKRILLFTGDAVTLGQVFCRDTHVVVVESVGQAVTQQGVVHHGVAQTQAGTCLVHDKGSQTHAFLTTSQHQIGIAQRDSLRRQMHDHIRLGRVNRLGQRLKLAYPVQELQPAVDQFNALMGRLERAYVQLESFNADVAHELRTPLTALIGQTEVALSRERSADSLRDTLASNLEEMQRLSAIVNDMLFLSQADRGAVARRSEPVSLAELAHQVAEFHEGVLDEAGLRLSVVGDARVAVDASLVKRAMSNLMGNASRFAEPGSTVQVRIEPDTGTEGRGVQVVVENRGPAIEPQHLPHLFDRFFRADAARCCKEEIHHGLGLAIVAAIARMHAGDTFARSQDRVTQIGFTLGPQTA